MSERGIIENRERAQQIINFKDLRFGNITPTDLDGVIEYRDKAYVFYEYKYLDAGVKYGQRLCLARMVNDVWKSGKYAIALVLEHDTHDTRADIPGAQCVVREYCFKPEKGWVQPQRRYTALEFTRKFLKWVDDGAKIGA